MKFFHLSDLHIGLKLLNRDMLEEQRYILEKVIAYAVQENVDAVVIAGDIYDKAVPSAEAVGVFDSFISGLTEALPDTVVMLISGNHDSAGRVDCYRNILSRQHVHMIGRPPRTTADYIEKVTCTDAYGAVNFYLLPYVKPSMIREITGTHEDGTNLSYDESICALLSRENIDERARNVIVSHQFYLPRGISADEIERADSEIRTVGNIDEVHAELLRSFDYAALGHIHKPMTVGCETIRYSGTPIACSVSEAGQAKHVVMVELGKKGQKPQITKLPLEPLHQVRIERGMLEEVLQRPSEDYVSVILTDKQDLDVIDLQDRLHLAFPNLLEIRRESQVKHAPCEQMYVDEWLQPMDLCLAFLGECEDDELELLQEVLNVAKEVTGR